MLRQWRSAWKVFAAVPFVLLCAIVALKVGTQASEPVAADDDTGAPSVQLTQDLGELPPSAGIRNTKAPSSLLSDLPSGLLGADGETLIPGETETTPAQSEAPSPTRTSSAPQPSKTTKTTSPSPAPSTSDTSSSSPTPEPSAPSEQACRDKYDGLAELQCLKLFP